MAAISSIGKEATQAVGNIGEDKNDIEALVKYKAALEEKYSKKLQKNKEKWEKQSANKSEAEKQKLAEKYRKATQKQAEKDEKDIKRKAAEYERELAKQSALEKKEAENELNELKRQNAENLGKSIKNTNAGTKAAFNAASKMQDALFSSVDKYLDIYSNYMSAIETRVQGLGDAYGFGAMDKKIRQNTALSPFVKYTSVMENLNRLVELGIADNLTERAFLATISDKIATTFDAAEASMLEIIRIQQKDTTKSRLGMEAELTKLFNANFGDTSYLSESFDSVQAALIDVSSQLSAENAVELEYQVQKWLGSLGAVGVSSNTLSSLAQGINYLGTGNIDALQGNTSLQNLLVMAANRAGLDYSSMLSGGINSKDTNALLYSVVKYIQDISQGNNNVVKQQYADLFGITISDMRAFQNLNESTLAQLYSNGMSYGDTLTSLNNELGTVYKRMHLSEMINNLMDNVMASVGTGIANNVGVFATYKAFDMLEKITGGIELPFISALGTGVDLNMSLEGIAKTGILGITAAVELINGLIGLSNGGALRLDNWSMGDRQKGGYVGFQSAETLDVNKSSTNYVSSGNEMGIQQSLNDTQKETGKQVQGSDTSEGEKLQQLIESIEYYLVQGGSNGKPLHVTIESANEAFYQAIRPYGGII